MEGKAIMKVIIRIYDEDSGEILSHEIDDAELPEITIDPTIKIASISPAGFSRLFNNGKRSLQK